MVGLASGHGPIVIARHRPDVGGMRLSERDGRLLAELTALARAPYETTPWPEPPAIELGRLVSDFDRTTGRRLELQLRWENGPGGGIWLCDITVDGKMRGASGGVFADPEEALA